MAVDQHGGAEIAVQPGKKPPQRPVIGLVEAFDAGERVIDRNAAVVDFLGVANHPGHRAEAAGDPHRTGIGEGRQAAVEHARVELIGLAVHIDIAARKMSPHQRIAMPDHPGHQLIDETVLGTAQSRDIEPGLAQERRRIGRTGMGRIEQGWAPAGGRFDDVEGRVEIVLNFTHGRRLSCGGGGPRYHWD